jgi:hypothetical protein
MSTRKTTDERKQRMPLAVRAATAGPRGIWAPALLLAALLILGLALASRAEAYIYWGDSHINRANVDGNGAQTLVSEAYAHNGMAVDGEHIYWAASLYANRGTQNTIARANLDGTGVDLSFITVTGPVLPGVGPPLPAGVAVDDEHVYWAYSDWANPDTGAIGRANLDGSGVDKNFISGTRRPSGVAVDDQHVYWGDTDARAIGRGNLDGSGVDHSFIGNVRVPFAVAVDAAHIYWANWGNGAVGRANLDGSGVNQRFIGAAGPDGLAVDATHIYWTTPSQSEWARNGAIWRAKLDGSSAECLVTGLSPIPGDLAVDALGPPQSDPPGCERPPPPSNTFSFGKVKKNKKKGTAKLTVKVPGPGGLRLAKSKKVKAKNKRADAEGKVKLPIKPRRKAKQKLATKGKVKVKAKVTFTPDGGDPNTQSKRLKLVKR